MKPQLMQCRAQWPLHLELTVHYICLRSLNHLALASLEWLLQNWTWFSVPFDKWFLKAQDMLCLEKFTAICWEANVFISHIQLSLWTMFHCFALIWLYWHWKQPAPPQNWSYNLTHGFYLMTQTPQLQQQENIWEEGIPVVSPFPPNFSFIKICISYIEEET